MFGPYSLESAAKFTKKLRGKKKEKKSIYRRLIWTSAISYQEPEVLI